MAATSLGIGLVDIERAARTIEGVACRTPLKLSRALSTDIREVRLKIESMQPTGAFKLRGAAAKLLSLSPDQRARGVTTASSGNHGRAVAYMAAILKMPAVVCMTTLVPAEKVAAIEALGAEVVIDGADQDVATARAQAIAAARDMSFVSPFDDAEIIAGQGTIALEILKDWPDVDTIIAPVSGGGLIGGIAVAAKAIKPTLRLVGVSLEGSAAIHDSIAAGRVVAVPEFASLADALPGPIPADNRYTLAICQALVDEIVLVKEDRIAPALTHAFAQEKLILEGGAVAGIAALHAFPERFPSGRIAIVLTGDNITPDKWLKAVRAASPSN